MRSALALLAAAAAIGSASYASAGVLVMEDGYNGIRAWGGWVIPSRDTTVAATGTASLKATTIGATEAYVRFVVGLDTPVAADSINPTEASMSFRYNLTLSDGSTTFPLSLGLQQGSWDAPKLSGTTTLIGDGQWHDGTINFTGGWIGGAPAAGVQMGFLRVEKDAGSFWAPSLMTVNLDHFVFEPTAVPEPATLGLLAGGSLLMLRRRRA